MQEDAEVLNLSWEVSRVAEQAADGIHLIVMTKLAARALEGHKRAPINVSLVLDRSGSMDGPKIEQCKYAARYAVSQLASTDVASVVIFDGQVQVLAPHGPVTQKDQIIQKIMGITPGGWTNLSGGWLQGASMVEKALAPGQVNRIVLLTDGEATHGVTDPGKLRGFAQDLQAKGIQTTTVGFGADFKEDLLRCLADAGGGNFHFIESPEEAPTVFAREFQELLTIVAQNVRLRILPASDVATVGLLQSLPTEAVPGGLEVCLGDLMAGDERNILVELVIPPSAAPRGITTLELTYQRVIEPIAFRELSAFVESGVSGASINPVVWREVLLSRVTGELKQARDEADSGKLADARKRLQEARKSLNDSEFQSDPTFLEQSHELERLEKMMTDRSEYENLGRKSLSSYEASSVRQKSYTKGGVLDPRIRLSLYKHSESVVFLTGRDLALDAGLPDPTQGVFEGLSFAQLARPMRTTDEAALQWRWIESRQQAIDALGPTVHRLLPGFERRWPTTAILTTATDGLHARWGPTMEVVELFGSLWRGHCAECEQTFQLAGLSCKEGIPLGACGHPLRPDIVWPGGTLPAAARRRTEELWAQADALIVLGKAAEQPAISQLLKQKGRDRQVRLAISPGARPDWADGVICEGVEEGVCSLARETSTPLPP